MIDNIITLLIGIATFIIGMNMMSGGLRKSTGKGVKHLFRRIQNNRFASFGIGLTTTALIQSSAATSIMVIGFISVGAMTIFQGIATIMGAYVGTTITGVIVSLSSFDFAKYFVLLAVIGVGMMFFVNDKVKSYGEILAGLGLLFFGLSTMTSAFKYSINGEVGPTELLNVFKNFFEIIEKVPANPLLFLLFGVILTALLQSSSATSGIVIVMVGGGAITLTSGLYLVLGACIGTVVTTLLASIGGNANVKKTALICLSIRTVSALLGLAIVWPLESNGALLSTALTKAFNNPQLALAMFLVIFNVAFMFLLLPLINTIIRLFDKLVKDKRASQKKQVLQYIDDLLLNNPQLALMQVNKEILHMFDLAYTNYQKGYKALISNDISDSKQIDNTESSIDIINNEVTNYLIALSNKVNLNDEHLIGSYFHIINDIERIGDHAKNFSDSAKIMNEKELSFSNTAVDEFGEMNKRIEQMFELSKECLSKQAGLKLETIHRIEEETDDLKIKFTSAHFDRITNKKCHVELSPFYSTFISELERVADHLVNIAYAFDNPTGDEQ